MCATRLQGGMLHIMTLECCVEEAISDGIYFVFIPQNTCKRLFVLR